MVSELLDENIVCPVDNGELRLADGAIISSSGRRYSVEDGIPRLFVDEDVSSEVSAKVVTHGVQEFYTDAPFPNYNHFDNVGVFVKRAREGVYARLLSEQIPMNSRVLEVGCGTGQLSNFLAATTMARIYASDMTPASLALGRKFATDNGLSGIKFLQMNLFRPCIRPGSMDIVISNGVLHHTYDTLKAYRSIANLVKPGGYIVVGLYNKIGRLRTDLRRQLLKLFGERVLILDPHLRKNHAPEKRRAWINDQYLHPCERKHSMSELLQWFDDSGFDFISSIPKILGDFSPDERLFERQNPGTPADRTMAEIGMLFSHYGGEGGLYIMIGKRRA